MIDAVLLVYYFIHYSSFQFNLNDCVLNTNIWRHSIINIFKMREMLMNTSFTLAGSELKAWKETTEHISKF